MDDNRVCFAVAPNIQCIVNSVKSDFEAIFLQDDGIMNAVKIKNSISFDLGDDHGVVDHNGIGDLQFGMAGQ